MMFIGEINELRRLLQIFERHYLNKHDFTRMMYLCEKWYSEKNKTECLLEL